MKSNIDFNDFFDGKKKQSPMNKKEQEDAIRRLHERLHLPLGIVFADDKEKSDNRSHK